MPLDTRFESLKSLNFFVLHANTDCTNSYDNDAKLTAATLT